MIADKKEFNKGLILMASFWLVFLILMSPVFPGKDGRVNCLKFMDNLYNSISKDSAYYIPKVREKAPQYKGKTLTVAIKAKDQEAARFKTLLAAGQAQVKDGAEGLEAQYDLGVMTEAMLADADLMFANKGGELEAKYKTEARQALYDWYSINKAMIKGLEKSGDFKTAKILYDAQTKAIEPAFNYYKIEATPIKSQLVTVVLSLVGYVIYTLWFGFAILFLFEGWGLKLDH